MSSPVWHPFTQHGLREPIPLVTHAEGAALYTFVVVTKERR